MSMGPLKYKQDVHTQQRKEMHTVHADAIYSDFPNVEYCLRNVLHV